MSKLICEPLEWGGCTRYGEAEYRLGKGRVKKVRPLKWKYGAKGRPLLNNEKNKEAVFTYGEEETSPAGSYAKSGIV
jgi:hypothetical protein